MGGDITQTVTLEPYVEDELTYKVISSDSESYNIVALILTFLYCYYILSF